MKEYTLHIPIHIFEKGNSNGNASVVKLQVNATSSEDAKNIVQNAILNLVFSNILGK